MAMCSQTRRVIEAYAPGINAYSFSWRYAKKLSASYIHLHLHAIQTLEQWRIAV